MVWDGITRNSSAGLQMLILPSDCNPGLAFRIPGFGIGNFVTLGSCRGYGISLRVQNLSTLCRGLQGLMDSIIIYSIVAYRPTLRYKLNDFYKTYNEKSKKIYMLYISVVRNKNYYYKL